ncbi:phosphate transport system permease protein PstC [Desulfocucumis palustris]|uniref:Phosphate transport system permease protein n=1 Tax=Desulfocucumis palustris TaxID=1898651 RepID=A0A2L2XAL2_9FIRM|nr:phosphate ABC transporter permease subunit PstC [Desulfocucumis palustris]GBF33235.1 phosphate transport system permease protein PstC [Desulfocucumis palustris]
MGKTDNNKSPIVLKSRENETGAAWRIWKKYNDIFGKNITMFCALVVIFITVSIVIFISAKGLSTFVKDGISPLHFLFSTQWWPDRPLEEGGPLVGSFAFIVGSLIISLLAVLVSAPLSIIVAVFMVEIAENWAYKVLQPAIEILAGIPSVVYGYVGLSLLVPFIRESMGGSGFSILAGFLVLSVMILPTVISVSADALRSLPGEWKEAALALGSTRWQTIRLVLVPAARSGLITGVILGLSRAFGEALAVQMVIGNTRKLPTSILDPIITLTSAITMDMGYTVTGHLWNNALWSMALLLLTMSLFFITLIRFFSRKGVVQ